MKVLMLPHVSLWAGNSKDESGIRRVVEAYFKYLPRFGVELVAQNGTSFDIKASHAGMGDPDADVSHCHGLYWSADYDAPAWEFKANANVIASVRHAKEVTVPSSWVTEAFRRDMRFTPHVIPHGIEWDDWQHERENEGYVLWNKNRNVDVCSTDALGHLSGAFPRNLFLSTFAPKRSTPNLKATGVVPHKQMREMIQSAGVYLSTTKETFGIGVLEAMASGVPVLGFAHGGNVDLVQHGVNGYLAKPGNLDDLEAGLNYCLQHRSILGANGLELAKQWTWEAACEKIAEVYRLANQIEPPTVAVIIPSFNYGNKVGQAVQSALQQDYENVMDVIVVDDGSTDNTEEVVKAIADPRVRYIKQTNSGVANARNRGISETRAKYIVCLDADDAIQPSFVSSLVPALEQDRSLGVVYTGIQVILADGRRRDGNWPGACQFDRQLEGENQVPTCCLFRREMWERLGGYKQRYAPTGQGAEDAEFWLRAGAYGWGIKQVTGKPLFLYSMAGRTTANPDYQEVEWTVMHPWAADKAHPFASIATPEHLSHPVRQYDEPTISVIIPVGPGHEYDVQNSLDGLEAQTFRKWEAVLINDTGSDAVHWLDAAYPYIRWVETDGKKGAGFARNRGVEAARGDFLVFLDADDWLYPDALAQMLYAWQDEQAIIYTDYVGKSIMSQELAHRFDEHKRLLRWQPDTGEAVVRYRSAEYDPALAQAQPKLTDDPNAPFYHWCLVTCLVPKSWHDEIGGFDEKMETWEDIEYHWRMARHGKCYSLINEPLIVYNFHTGHRREHSRSLQVVQKMVQYITRKFEGIEIMPCSGCGGKRPRSTSTNAAYSPFVAGRSARSVEMDRSKDDSFVLIRYTNPNRSRHSVVGSQTQIRYNYRQFGELFYVHRNDIWVGGDENAAKIGTWFEPVPREMKINVEAPKVQAKATAKPKPLTQRIRDSIVQSAQEPTEQQREPLPEPEPIADDEMDLQAISGIGPKIAEQLNEHGVTTARQLLEFGQAEFQGIKGVSEAKAEIVFDLLGKMLEETAA